MIDNIDKAQHILEESRRIKAEQEEDSLEQKKTKIVIFTLGNKFYAFKGEFIKEILYKTEITYVPGSPNYFPGVINVRGDIESVLDINLFLQLPPVDYGRESKIAICSVDGIRSGVLFGSVVDVVDVISDSIKNDASNIESEIKKYVLGQLDFKGMNILLLDLEKMLNQLMLYEKES